MAGTRCRLADKVPAELGRCQAYAKAAHSTLPSNSSSLRGAASAQSHGNGGKIPQDSTTLLAGRPKIRLSPGAGSGAVAGRFGNAKGRRTSLPLRGERAGVRESVFQTLRWNE